MKPNWSNTLEDKPRLEVPLITIFTSYLVVGITAFGMAIIQKLKALVIDNQWLSQEEMNEGLALVQLYPGPIMVDFTAYVGYKLRGIPGAVVATLGFILPTYALMIILSALYFSVGNLPWVHPLFLGLEALVVGVVLNVTLDLAGQNIQNRASAIIALSAFTALLFQMNAVLIVIAALALGAIFLRPKLGVAKVSSDPLRTTPNVKVKWIGIGVVIAVVLAGVVFAWLLPSENGTMGLVFFKIGSVAFGNGMTIIPLIQADVVDVHHWLSLNQFADGIALGQVTPGPFLITAAFVGYKLGGMFGATLATFAIFSPSFAMTLVFTELFARVRNWKAIRGALAGVLAAFVGLLAVVLLQLGGLALTIPATLALAAASFIAVCFFRIDIVWVFMGGLVIWAMMLGLGVA
jgi:chromate transporter